MVTALTQPGRIATTTREPHRSDLTIYERAACLFRPRLRWSRPAWQDDYITSLATTQSQNGIRQGTLFCHQNVGIFAEVMALQGIELPLAATKQPAQPMVVTACLSRPAPHRPTPASVANAQSCRIGRQRRASCACTSSLLLRHANQPGRPEY
jgi:hypothetical protein